MWFDYASSKREDTLKIDINAIYRVKIKRGEEYYLFNATKRCLSGDNKPISFSHDLYGYHKQPVIVWRHSQEKHANEPTVTEYAQGYENPWDKEEVRKLLEGSDVPCEHFYVGREGITSEPISDQIYSINNVQDFLEGSFEDLWDL